MGICINVTQVLSDQELYTNFETDIHQCMVSDKSSHCTYYYQYGSQQMHFKLSC